MEADKNQQFYLPLGKERCKDMNLLLLLCRYLNLELHITHVTMKSFVVTITDKDKQVVYINPLNDTITGCILIQMGFKLNESCNSMNELQDINMKVLKLNKEFK